MLKFIRQYADKIDGIQIYPVVSLVIFVVFFLAVLVYVKKMRQSRGLIPWARTTCWYLRRASLPVCRWAAAGAMP